MNKDQKRLLTRLLAWSVACPVLAMMISMGMTASDFVIGLAGMFGGHLLVLGSFVVLSWSVWRAVRKDMLGKMEAWWWLSTPYSVAVPLAAFVALGPSAGAVLILFFIVWGLTSLLSSAWALVTICRVFFFHTEEFTLTTMLMLASAAVVGLMAFAYLISSG